jgi:hypothetical protein
LAGAAAFFGPRVRRGTTPLEDILSKGELMKISSSCF